MNIIIIIIISEIGISLEHLNPMLEFSGVELGKVGEDGIGAAEDELHPAAGGRDLAAEPDPRKGVVDEADAEEAEAVRQAGDAGDGKAGDDGVTLNEVATPGDVGDGRSKEG